MVVRAGDDIGERCEPNSPISTHLDIGVFRFHQRTHSLERLCYVQRLHTNSPESNTHLTAPITNDRGLVMFDGLNVISQEFTPLIEVFNMGTSFF